MLTVQPNERRQRRDQLGPSPALLARNPRRYSAMTDCLFGTGSYISESCSHVPGLNWTA